MPTVLTKQNDTKITFVDYPTINGVAVPPSNFTGCTVSWIIKNTSGSVLFKRAAQINADGSFSYVPTPTDVAVADTFQQEWEVVYPGNLLLTFPNGTYNTVKILPDLG